MMDYKIILGFLGVLITILWYSWYIKDIIILKTKPHLFTWLIWWIITFIWFFIQFQNWWKAGSWVTWITSILCFIIFILSLKYWVKKFKKSDIISFILAIIAIILWLYVKIPLYSVILISIIDALWFYPTYRKSFYHPSDETLITFFVMWLKYNIAIFALGELSLVTTLYPIYVMFISYSFVIYNYVRRCQLRKVWKSL